jgi:peptidoglycan/LPS O-acetylase OafA/YrhL
MRPKRLTLYCSGFIIASILAGAAGILGVLSTELRVYGDMAYTTLTIAFTVLASCAFFVLIYVRKKYNSKQKWYVAALSPALFLLLFIFFRGSVIWEPYLLDVYGILFAMLIVIYLGSMFSWKTVFLFAGFLTSIDMI